MKLYHAALRLAALASVLGMPAAFPAAPATASGLPVFDAANYSQNLVEAARALEHLDDHALLVELEHLAAAQLPRG